jgi:hypothetical protein
MASNVETIEEDTKLYSWIADQRDGPSGIVGRMTIAEMRRRVAAGDYSNPRMSIGAEDFAVQMDHIYPMNTAYGREWHPYRGWRMGSICPSWNKRPEPDDHSKAFEQPEDKPPE